jgi:hypothetical protein
MPSLWLRRAPLVVGEMPHVARRTRAEIDLEEEPRGCTPAFASFTCVAYEKADLLVRRPGRPAFLAEAPRRTGEGRDAVGAASKRRMNRMTRMSALTDETTIESSSTTTFAHMAPPL